jgi:multiple sugar transport system permease protein
MKNKSVKKGLYYTLLWIISLAAFSPVLWIFLAGFKTRSQILSMPPEWIFTPTLENFKNLFTRYEFFGNLLNSIVISIAAVIIGVIVSFLASYSFSRFRPKGTDFVMFLLLSMRMVPGAAVIVPVFLMYAFLGWKNTYGGMILYYAMFSIPFSVWILKGFMDGISRKFDETALVNGAGHFHIMTKIILPQVKPGIMAAFIFNLIFVWNEFLFNFIIGGNTVKTVPVLLAIGAYTSHGYEWGFIGAASVLFITPLLILLFVFQKYLLVGMTFGTVRGEI